MLNKETKKYAVIDGQEIERGVFEIFSMIEKAEPEKSTSILAIIGRYILTPDVFTILENQFLGTSGEVQLTNAKSAHAKTNVIIGFKFTG